MTEKCREAGGAGYGTEPAERVLADDRAPGPGPTLICVGGLHGNEPAGVRAIQRVEEVLEAEGILDHGDFIGLAGNLAALRRGQRFVERDLNRAWTRERVAGLRVESPGAWGSETTEQLELLEAIDDAAGRARGPLYVLDLHTTSGPGGIFSVFGDALPQRTFAERFPVPMVLGLEELVDGTLIQFLGERGMVAITVETGRHDAPEAVDRAEAAVWVALGTLGMLSSAGEARVIDGERDLRRASSGLPRVLEMRFRHAVEAGDGFEMLPGYRNFNRVEGGEIVARDRSGEIRAPETARLLMPLYQDQGEDGFFLVRRFSPAWMVVSRWLRFLHADRAARWLPGVRPVPGEPDAVSVDRRTARFFAKQLFHLLGFRKIEECGPRLIMRRRSPPRSLSGP